jgi:5-formyltetrahydrofolate cyclo-ligase
MKWLKQRIRKRINARRNQLTPAQCGHLELKIAHSLFKLPQFQQAKHVALYLPVNNEVATQLILQKIYELQKNAYVPILSTSRRLEFVEITPNATLVKNRLGILEPKGDIIPLQRLDLVLTPLVAFDKNCHRIGMGGGFYDATFKDKAHLSLHLIGLAYELQKVWYVPHTNLDIKLDGVVTEKHVYGLN